MYLFRGKSYLNKNKVDKAKEDLVKAARLAPGDSEIQAEYNELRKKIQQESSREQTVYKAVVGQMFGGDNWGIPKPHLTTSPANKATLITQNIVLYKNLLVGESVEGGL